MDISEFFFRLTPDRIFSALEDLGLNPSRHWMQLNSLENRVFSIALQDGAHVVVKFYRPERWSREQILEEHRFLFDLAEAEVPVCVPMRIAGTSLHSIDNIYYAVWPRTGGRQVDEFSHADLEMLGRLMGRIHSTGKVSAAPARLVYGSEKYIHEPLRFFKERQIIPVQYASRYEAAALALAELYDAAAQDVPVHRIHGDCHPGNLLLSNEGYFFLDFDDFLTGPAVQDFWMLLPGGDAAAEQAFLEGYGTFAAYQPSWLKLIEVLRAFRFVHYAAWVARRWEDPAFPAAFPHFGTEAYWAQETTDLEEQLAIAAETLRGIRPAPEKVLDNKDYFWDME